MSDFDATSSISIRKTALPVMDLFCSFSSIFFCVHSVFRKTEMWFSLFMQMGVSMRWWDTEPKSWKTTMVKGWINTRNGESPKLKPKWIMDLKDSRLRKLQEMGFLPRNTPLSIVIRPRKEGAIGWYGSQCCYITFIVWYAFVNVCSFVGSLENKWYLNEVYIVYYHVAGLSNLEESFAPEFVICVNVPFSIKGRSNPCNNFICNDLYSRREWDCKNGEILK